MGVLAKIRRFMTNPQIRFGYLSKLGIYNRLSDEAYLRKAFRVHMGYELDLNNVRTFNEKLQWLKLYNRRPEYTMMVDKYAVKEYIADEIGEEYVIPTLGVWEHFDDINFDELPNQFVLKCTHDSGGLVICRDKEKLDLEAAREKINCSLKRNYYWHGREWPYKNVKPRIIAEKYMEDPLRTSKNLNVYKIFTFNGIPKIIQTIQNDKTRDEVIDYFDCEWNLLDLRQNYPNSNDPLPRPKNLDVMFDLAGKMSQGFPFLRVDFYEISDRIYFSEFTFYSDNGTAKFSPETWDEKLGSWIELPKVK